MCDILFRAKAINRDKGYHKTTYKNGDWVYGLVTRLYDERFENLPAEMTNINGVSGIEVDYKTIGQYTGLTDKNGRKIFEGDIVHAIYQSNYVGMKNIDFGIGVVEYCGNYYSHASYEINIIGEIGSRVFSASLEGGVEVIGNIHDNPELIETAAKPADKNIAQSTLAPATENFELMEG